MVNVDKKKKKKIIKNLVVVLSIRSHSIDDWCIVACITFRATPISQTGGGYTVTKKEKDNQK